MIKDLSLFGVLLFSLISCSSDRLEPDDEIIKRFIKDRSSYEELADIVIDKKLTEVRKIKTSEGLVFTSHPTLPPDDILHVKNLMNNLDIKVVLHDVTKGEEKVEYYVSSAGFVFGGELKGIVYSYKGFPLSVVKSLDKIEKSNKKGRFYSEIEPKWYLFYEFDD